MPDFVHLHCHTQYSLLDGASDIGAMLDKAVKDGQSAVALTDHGNMFGAFKFVSEAKSRNIKPIVGCEFYMVNNRHEKSFEKSKGKKDIRYHQLLLAKNAKGYTNLSKLCSLGYIQGYYSKYPRIDKALIVQYREGLIATSCCLGAEIPQTILSGNLQLAEEKLRWWLELFGDDFYIELQRHRGLEVVDQKGMSQEEVNQVLLNFAAKYQIKTIATNDTHYVEEEDWQSHDILLCVNTASFLEDKERMRFPSSDFYFKTKKEMEQLFHDLPQSLDNTLEIADKISTLDLTRDVLLPAFPLPNGIKSQEEYLRILTFDGARRRYPNITPTIEERLNFELEVINKSGYAGYFLIVQDFTNTALKMGVSVGPGRGSAAGSAVAYCLGITHVDPIKYNLLFERFLNPERVSMPDIDIDFDDEGRSKVIDYVIEKYGRNQVAQIITYGTMAAKSSIRDVGRVMQIPLYEVDKVAKSFPSHLGATLDAILKEGGIDEKLKDQMNSEDVDKAIAFRKLAEEENDIGKMIRTAKKLEGSVRNTGIHACGVIITPGDITNYVPVATAKESDLLVSQYDNSVAELAGLLKMDFLGLKTLSIIKETIEMVKETSGIELDPEQFNLEDEKTYELFQKGETNGIFQYESIGMQKNLKELKPTRFDDLIAMNALYRPGPMQYIPNFIARKHGRDELTYDLPEMEEYLKETYGITVYQEQVMLLSQKLAGFSKGQADKLRKAMGKKKKDLIDELFPKFMEGCEKNGHSSEICEKIWKDWEAFASYAFNKSHSTCYALIGFQTAYLKAHYPAQFMASVLNYNKNDITKLNFYLRECKRMGIRVSGPDINESKLKFTVNKKGLIRFGLSALKGVGKGPVEAIQKARELGGPFISIYDLAKRVNLRAVNKKCMESLALGGAFDSFEGIHRAQYFAPAGNHDSMIEQALWFGNTFQQQKAQSQISLFGDMEELYIDEPQPPSCEEWNAIERLEKEKEVTGMYVSGHPLDDYEMEMKNYTNCSLVKAVDVYDVLLKVAGIVTEVFHGISQKGTGYCRFTIQDYNGALKISIFNEQYEQWKSLLFKGNVLYIEGMNSKVYNNTKTFFRVKDIKMLDTVGKLLTKSITLKIEIQQLNQNLLNEIHALCDAHQGQHLFKLRVIDRAEDIELDFVSKNTQVNVSSKLLNSLDDLGLFYRLN
ncbi:MAG TPA: DNA polymerase III subunit alpha [Saprospiraceae bacterium]|nr:DNA polymerase III subunit alpha [Saprospiraceae bacterium]